jgi:hypothetical protein
LGGSSGSSSCPHIMSCPSTDSRLTFARAQAAMGRSPMRRRLSRCHHGSRATRSPARAVRPSCIRMPRGWIRALPPVELGEAE